MTTRSRMLAVAAACAVALGITGCAGSGEGVRVEGSSAIPRAEAEVDAGIDGARVDIADGRSGGLGPAISVTFDRPVPAAERAGVERQLRVVMESDAQGSWSWVKGRDLAPGQRVDFRPRVSWTPGTRVTVQVGADLTRHFTIAAR
ncbi:Ig-like domain-containing protein [Streptomyces sp. NPDC002787]